MLGWISKTTEDCDFSIVPTCRDCEILNEWQPAIFSTADGCCDLEAELIVCEGQKVVKLNLSSRLFSNTSFIPESLLELVKLEFLDLSNNSLSGPIPSGIQVLTSLSMLNLASNQFTSAIPSSIGDLTNLVILDLRNNQFTSNVPGSMLNLVRLKELYLSDNLLEGVLPDIQSLDVYEIGNNNGLRVAVSVDEGCIGQDCENSNSDTISTRDYQTPFIIGMAGLTLGVTFVILLVVAFIHHHRQLRIKDVKFIKKLDNGAFGEVWKAKYKEKPVAVKVLLESRVTIENKISLLKKLVEEAEMMQQLSHERVGILQFA